MLFSVIVPIYKVEKYIRRCIESVLSQSFGDFELILVDDGSPDNCPSICDEYAKTDSRIKVIHKENGGLVSARKAGLEIATGNYVLNLDGDDAFGPDALEKAEQIVKEYNVDIASFAYNHYIDGEICEAHFEPLEQGFYDKTKAEKEIHPKLLSDKNMVHVNYFLCGKAIKRELLYPHQMKVNTAISLGEDLSCIVPCYLAAETVYISHEAIYLYTIRNDSISTDFKTGQITQIADVIESLHNISLAKPADFDSQIARYSCFMCFAIMAAAAEGNHNSAVKKIKELITNSVHKAEIKKASFENITIKSRIAIFLMKKNCYKASYLFLNLCKKIKGLRKGDKP